MLDAMWFVELSLLCVGGVSTGLLKSLTRYDGCRKLDEEPLRKKKTRHLLARKKNPMNNNCYLSRAPPAPDAKVRISRVCLVSMRLGLV